jgi:hypothetical protein
VLLQSSRFKCSGDAESQVTTLHDKHLVIVCLPNGEVKCAHTSDVAFVAFIYIFLHVVIQCFSTAKTAPQKLSVLVSTTWHVLEFFYRGIFKVYSETKQ